MKINGEINTSINQKQRRKVASRQSDVSVKAQVNQSKQNPQTGTTAARGSIRDMSEALLIMQKAQTIVQQALTVSSRLQNIAIGSVSSGEIAFQEVDRELRSVNTAFTEYGQEAAGGSFQVSGAVATPDIRNEITVMQGMVESQNIDQTEINRVYNSLQETSTAVDKDLVAMHNTIGTGNVPEAANVSREIESNPAMAVTAQGNLVPERVNTLT